MVFIDSKDKNTYLKLQGLKKFEIHINLLLNKLKNYVTCHCEASLHSTNSHKIGQL